MNGENRSRAEIEREMVLSTFYHGLGPIRQWLDDDSVTEIMVNPGGKVFVESSGEIAYKGELFTEEIIKTALQGAAKFNRKDMLMDSASSIVNASIDNLRISGAQAPVSPKGSFITIRKHMDASHRPSLEELVTDKQALTQDQADLLVELIVNRRYNCIFAGGTGSGKTTLINAVLAKIPHYERVISVEDAKELEIKVPNSFPIITNPDIGITARLAIQTLLRQRPDRIILGETRGDETYDLIRALNSGHPGSMTSIHANSALDALDSLQMLYQMSLPANASISTESARHFISRVVHLVVYVDRHVQEVDGRYLVLRGVAEICLVKGVDRQGRFVLEDVTTQGKDHAVEVR